MSALTFKISAELSAAGFTAAAEHMRQLGQETDRLKQKQDEHKGGVNLLKSAYEALAGAGIVEFFKASFEAAAEAREQQIQLASRVEQTGLNYDKAKPKLDAFFEALSAQSGIEKDKLIPAMDFLIDKTNSVRASQELMTTTMGLARARGLQLTDAADLVAGAYNGQQRSILQLSKILGMTTEQAKDHEKVLAALKERYGAMATQTDKAALAQGRLAVNFKEAQEQIGQGLVGPLTFVLKVLNMIVVGLKGAGEAYGVFWGTVAATAMKGLEALNEAAHGNFREAKRLMTTGMAEIRATALEEMGKIGEAMEAAMNPAKIKQNKGNLVDDTKHDFEKMSDDMKKIVAEGAAYVAKTDKERVDTRLVLIDIETEGMKNKMKQQEDFQRLAATDQNKILTAIERKGAADRAKVYAEEAKAKIDIFMKSGIVLGTALAQSLAGQKDAWKKSLISIIDMVAQQVEAIITANTARDVSMLPGGIANPLAWGLIASGTGQVALVAGVAEAAKAAIGGGGGAGAPSTGGFSSAAGPSSGAAAGAAPASGATRSEITINVQGDVVDGDAFMQSLAARLSSKVENSDVRLIASGVK